MNDMNKINCILSAQYCSPEMAAQNELYSKKKKK